MIMDQKKHAKEKCNELWFKEQVQADFCKQDCVKEPEILYGPDRRWIGYMQSKEKKKIFLMTLAIWVSSLASY